MRKKTLTSVRLDDDVLEAVKANAKANDRSVSGEIQHIIRTALKADGAAA